MEMMSLFMAAYVAVCGVLAWLGRDTRVGPVLIFLISLFVTPIFPAIYVMIVRLERKS